MKQTDKEMDRLIKLSGPELREIHERLGKVLKYYNI